MHGLARMLLFWQAVEELRLVEYRQVEATVRDRLAWTLYKTFLHEGASINSPWDLRNGSLYLFTVTLGGLEVCFSLAIL